MTNRDTLKEALGAAALVGLLLLLMWFSVTLNAAN